MIRLNFAMDALWSDIPGFDVTSTTVSDQLVRIKSSVFSGWWECDIVAVLTKAEFVNGI